MTDWSTFWNTYPNKAEETDLLRQVGKTVGGVAINQEQFRAIISSIIERLDIRKEDRVLDLCCGNGLLTREIARHCDSVLGIDFSAPLIDAAKKYSSAGNIEYRQMDIRRLGELLPEYRSYFNKVMCYEALAFFDTRDLDSLLKDISTVCADKRVILFGSVLDKDNRWKFFNTFSRKMIYLVKIKLFRREVGLGRWWKTSEVEKICSKNGMRAEFFPQNPVLHTAHYRFDARIF